MTRSVQLYRDGSKLVYCTGESPPQFPGVLYITLEGETPDTVEEAVRTVAQLRGLQGVEVSTLSVQWKKALGLPEVEPSPKRQDTRPSSPQRGGRGATPNRTIQVVETRYIKCAPNLGWFSLNLYIGLGLLSILFGGANLPFLLLVMFLSGFAVLYACAATYMGGKVKHGQIDRGYFIGR